MIKSKNPGPRESSSIWHSISILSALAGAYFGTINLMVCMKPSGRISIASPASSIFAGFILTYFSLICYFSQKGAFTNLLSFLNNKSAYYMWLFILGTNVFAAFFYMLLTVPDICAAFLNALNSIQLYKIMDLASKCQKDDTVEINSNVQISDQEGLIHHNNLNLVKANGSSKKEDSNCLISLFSKLGFSAFHIIFLALLLLASFQPIYEWYHEPQAINGEQYVTVKHDCYDIQMRVYCTGPKNITSPALVLEAGGGSSGIDFSGIQGLLEKDYTVCSYDRAGYGKSWQGPYPQSEQASREIMVKTMREVGIPIDRNSSVVCIGHSVGGQLCRNYAKHLSSIRAIILLDSVPVMNSFQIYANKTNQSAENVIAQQQYQVVYVQAISSIWPLFLGSLIMGNQESTFRPSEYAHWNKWNVITSRNWHSQSLGEMDEVYSCDLNCSLKPVFHPDNYLNVPVIVLTANNQSIGCTERNKTGTDCDLYLAGQATGLQLALEQAQLGSPYGIAEQCDGICDHDFLWVKYEYVYSRIIEHLQNLPQL